MKSKLTRVSTILLLLFVSRPSYGVGKLTLDEVVAKHLESIGSVQNLKGVTTRIISGASLVIFRTTPTGQASGKAVLASDGSKNLIGMSFYSPVYPREQFGFNGHDFMAAFVTPGVRSSLGSFLMLHEFIFKSGLMGGTLSSAWPLLDLSAQKGMLEYEGLKKVKDQNLHELRYQPKNGSELQVSIFLDEKTFEHVRTEYQRVIPASTGDRTTNQERERRYKLVEEFSLFRLESGLNLPHIYRIEFAADTQSGTFLAEWPATFAQFAFNQPIDPAAFNTN